MIGICAGLALRGYRPFAYTIAPFTIYRPFEFVRDDLCYQHLPVTLVGLGAGMTYAGLGGTHHTPEDVAVMGALPNLSIVAPCDPPEVEAATWACAEQRGPVYLRLAKTGEPVLTGEAVEPFQFGKLRRLKNGTDACLLSYGPIMQLTLEAAAALERERGYSVAVVSCHTLKPLDAEGLARVLEAFPVVGVVEEHSERGGLGAQVKQLAWDTASRCALRIFALKDAFIHTFGLPRDLWAAHGITLEAITAGIHGALCRGRVATEQHLVIDDGCSK